MNKYFKIGLGLVAGVAACIAVESEEALTSGGR